MCRSLFFLIILVIIFHDEKHRGGRVWSWSFGVASLFSCQAVGLLCQQRRLVSFSFGDWRAGETKGVCSFFFLFGVGTEMNGYGGMDMGYGWTDGIRYWYGMELELVRTGMTGLVVW